VSDRIWKDISASARWARFFFDPAAVDLLRHWGAFTASADVVPASPRVFKQLARFAVIAKKDEF
jgi:hypothetical protein